MQLVFGILGIVLLFTVIGTILQRLVDWSVLKGYLASVILTGLLAVLGALLKLLWAGLGGLLIALAGYLLIGIAVVACVHLMAVVANYWLN